MKRLIIISLLLSMVYTTNAQLFKIFGHEVGFIYVGPKVGANYSKITEWIENTDLFENYRLGYQFGAVGELGFTSRFSIQPELVFFSRGAHDKSLDGNLRMNYIGIPLLAKVSFNVLGLKKVYLMGGTFTDIRTGGAWVDSSSTSPLGSGFKKLEWGFGFGCGAEYPAKYGIWGLDIRYNLGMTDIHDDAGDNVNSKSRSIGVSLTYKYDLVDLFFRLKNKNKTEGK